MFSRRNIRSRRAIPLAATVAASALIAAACGGDGGGGDQQPAEQQEQDGSFSMDISEPEFLSPPSQCYDTSCYAAVNLLYSGLADYNMEEKKVELVVAESIETTDNIHWTIKLKEGWEFHNGEAVNAEAFIRAWNYTAYGPNAVETNFFFTQFEGYDAMNPAEGEEPTAKELSGLKKIDEYTFEVTLTEPFGPFKTMLTFISAFAPMAEECLADTDACNEKPIGNGRYTIEEWVHDQSITLHRWDDYQGEKGNVQTIVLKIYNDSGTVYRDFQSGNLDILNVIDPSKIEAVKTETPEERLIQEAGDAFTYLGIELNEPGYTPQVRHALSLAIDRELIGQQIFAGIRFPAKSLIPPVINGGATGACEYCTYDPERAKQLMADAGGPPQDTITIYFNAGGGHEEWTQAVGNMWRDTFGIDFELKPMNWDEYLQLFEKDEVNGPFRLGWSMDYPHILNYLKPMYSTGAGSNYTEYSNPEVDALLEQCASALDPAEQIELCQQAEKLILEDMPTIPVYFYNELHAFSDRVTNVNWDGFHQFRLAEVELAQ